MIEIVHSVSEAKLYGRIADVSRVARCRYVVKRYEYKEPGVWHEHSPVRIVGKAKAIAYANDFVERRL